MKKHVAIITGGASGIGKAIALAFAKSNYEIFLFCAEILNCYL